MRWDTFWTKEPETLSWIDSFDPSDCFWDVGANVGVYSLYAASLYPQMPIYVFEPMEENYKALNYNKKSNEFSNIKQFRFALGSIPGQFRLSVPDDSRGATGAQVNESEGYPVRVETVDNLVERYGCKPPDHVKIDIDGQEMEVIKGMKNVMPKIKSILVEVSKKTKSMVWFTLLEAGFTGNNPFNVMNPHSRERRAKEGIDAENIIFIRR